MGVLYPLVAVGIGAYLVAVVDRIMSPRQSGPADVLLGPVRSAALSLSRDQATTERPDAEAWMLAPALLVGLAAVGAFPIPFGGPSAGGDIANGLVLFGAAMLIVLVAVFLYGWGPNSLFPMIGAFRFAAMVLSLGIPFSLVVLTTAIPAQSLSVGAIVASQANLWYVIEQPLGLPVYLITSAALAFWGPFDLPQSPDLAGGIDVESSGVRLLAWRFGRAGILTTLSLMGAAVFLGGYLGPVLPGWAWMSIKTLAILGVLAASGRVFVRMRVERFVWLGWVVLLPLALVDVFVSGWVALR